MFRIQPVYALNLEQLRKGGRFALPKEGEETKTEESGKETSETGEDQQAGEDQKSKSDPASRIGTLVEERNAARTEAQRHRDETARLKQEIQQLKATDHTATIAELQSKLTATQEATKTRFDKLLEVELAALPDTAANAVKAIPGGSEVQFDWLIANRALFQAAGKIEEKSAPEGAKHEKKPDPGKVPGVSPETQARIDRANARVRKGSGWSAVAG